VNKRGHFENSGVCGVDNIRMGLKEIGYKDWIHLAREWDDW
jgi:hypothetical protein